MSGVVVVVEGWNSPVTWILVDDVVACTEAEKLRA